MSTVPLLFHILAALALIGVVLIQRNEGGRLGIGGGGGGMSDFMTGPSGEWGNGRGRAVSRPERLYNISVVPTLFGMNASGIARAS